MSDDTPIIRLCWNSLNNQFATYDRMTQETTLLDGVILSVDEQLHLLGMMELIHKSEAHTLVLPRIFWQ